MATNPPKRRNARRWLLALSIALVSAEGLLQAGYAIMWWLRAPSATARQAGDGPVVLCVGDSFTFGMGASSPERSYPAQLQERLRRQAGAGWRVENLGWPGRNSREVLESIDRLMAQTQPDYLCVLVGANDAWSRPAELTLTEWRRTQALAPAREPYVWTFRLGRLFATFRAMEWLGGRAGSESATPVDPARIVGNWVETSRQVDVAFAADGSGTMGSVTLRWRLEAAKLVVEPVGLAPIVGFCRFDGGALVVQSDASSAGLRLLRAEDPEARRDRLRDGERSLGRGEWGLARDAFAAELAEAPAGSGRAAMARSGLARSLAALGQRELSLAELAALRGLHVGRADPETAAALAGASLALGFEDEAFELLAKLVERPEASAAVWSQYSHLAAKRGDVAEARRAIDRAIELAKDAPAGSLAPLLRARALLFATDAADRGRFASDAVRALLDDRNPRLTLQLLGRWRAKEGSEDALIDACATLGAPAEVRDVVVALLRDARGEGTDGWRRVLTSHLRQLVVRARRASVEPILLTYPVDQGMRAIVRSLADDEGCAWVEVDEAFAGLAAREPGRVLFVADGHCNDDGYGVIADAVARTLASVHAASGGRRKEVHPKAPQPR